MYLSDRDIQWAIETGKLIVDPPPQSYDATSIDLHLDTPDEAKIWDIDNGKSTKARSGLVVHLTAPTIHASWSGKITLEITNLGPFDFVLCENDVIAQLTVAKISSPPGKGVSGTSTTYGQRAVHGRE